MQTLSFWSRPVVFALFWILAAALTLSELATIAPALHSASGAPRTVRALVRQSAGDPPHGPARLAAAR